MAPHGWNKDRDKHKAKGQSQNVAPTNQNISWAESTATPSLDVQHPVISRKEQAHVDQAAETDHQLISNSFLATTTNSPEPGAREKHAVDSGAEASEPARKKTCVRPEISTYVADWLNQQSHTTHDNDAVFGHSLDDMAVDAEPASSSHATRSMLPTTPVSLNQQGPNSGAESSPGDHDDLEEDSGAYDEDCDEGEEDFGEGEEDSDEGPSSSDVALTDEWDFEYSTEEEPSDDPDDPRPRGPLGMLQAEREMQWQVRQQSRRYQRHEARRQEKIAQRKAERKEARRKAREMSESESDD